MAEKLETKFKDFFDDSLNLAEVKMEQSVAELLLKARATISVAESMTGGLIAERLTRTPGSSEYFIGGIVAYHPRIKVMQLGVNPKLIGRWGVVNPQVVESMAANVRERFKTTLGLATTGFAGPALREGEPVGLTFIALATPEGTKVKKFIFDGTRGEIRFKASQAALGLVWFYLGGAAP